MKPVRSYIIIAFTLIGILCSHGVEAQGFYKKRYMSMPKFRANKKMKSICPIFTPNEFPYQGIGVKLGDPTTINYKLYLSRNFAIELGAGRALSFLYNQFHEDNFSNFEQFDTLTYQGHEVQSETVIQMRAMIHSHTLDAMVQGLDLFVGFGWQFRDYEVEYDYQYSPDSVSTVMGTSTISEFSSGPEIFVGVEYAPFELPISIYSELAIFQNLDVDGARPRLQGGIGVRFIF